MITVKFIKDHIHEGTMRAAGSQMEVTPALFEKMQRVGAVEAVHVQVAGADVDMAVAAARRDEERAKGTSGTPLARGLRRNR